MHQRSSDSKYHFPMPIRDCHLSSPSLQRCSTLLSHRLRHTCTPPTSRTMAPSVLPTRRDCHQVALAYDMDFPNGSVEGGGALQPRKQRTWRVQHRDHSSLNPPQRATPAASDQQILPNQAICVLSRRRHQCTRFSDTCGAHSTRKTFWTPSHLTQLAIPTRGTRGAHTERS